MGSVASPGVEPGLPEPRLYRPLGVPPPTLAIRETGGTRARLPGLTGQCLSLFGFGLHGGRYWDRTSALLRVKQPRYRCANRPGRRTPVPDLPAGARAVAGPGSRAPGRTRTSTLLIRSQLHDPVVLRALELAYSNLLATAGVKRGRGQD